MSFDTDVAILGGGPSGSICAALLRKQCPQLRVTVFEKETFPRHHIGEASLPGWAPILRRAGVLEAAQAQAQVDKLGFIFNWGGTDIGEYWTADFRNEAGSVPLGSWHVDRAELDLLLLTHAAELGADVRQPARVLRVDPLSGPTPPPQDAPSPGFAVHFEQDGREQRLTAHRVVDASGQARLLTRQWSLRLHQHKDMNNYAVYGYWRGGQVEMGGGPLRDRERWAVISTHELGWVWHIPITQELTSVGLVTTSETLAKVGRTALKETYLKTLGETDRICELLEGATYVGDRPTPVGESAGRVSVVADWSYRCDDVCGAGWFVVGDGALFVDPILSSGLTLAATGSNMVANAITTLERQPETEAGQLRASVREAYHDISTAYHRMARVWYQRNTRAQGWHWQARQERLRTAGGAALFEADADAFTAVCLGVINSPLNAALPNHSIEVWGAEYFTWISADLLFGRAGSDDQGRSAASGVQEARVLARRSLVQRWQQLVDGRLRLKADWQVASGFHTNRFMEQWLPIRYVSVSLDDPLDPHLRVACPAFEDCPEGIFPALDGQAPMRAALVGLLEGRLEGTPARDSRLKAMSETILQLDMLGLLEVEPGPPPPRLTGHPLLTVIANVVLRSLDAPTTVYLEVDWLGECVWVRLLQGETFEWLRLVDGGGGDSDKDCARTATTRLQWPRGLHAWLDAVAAGVLRRLQVLETGKRAAEVAGFWTQMRPAAGQGIAFDHVPGQPPTARPL